MPVIAAAGAALKVIGAGSALKGAMTVASTGLGLLGAKKQADAAKSAANTMANAQQQAADAQVQSQREALAAQQKYLDDLKALYQPEIRAASINQAKLDALANGTGNLGAYLPQGTAGSNRRWVSQDNPNGSRPSLEQFIASNPGLEGYWNSWEAGGAAKGKFTHRQKFGDFEGYATDEYRKAYGADPYSAPTREAGQTSDYGYWEDVPASEQAASGNLITRQQVMDEIEQNPLTQYGLQEADQLDALGQQEFDAGTGAAGAFRDQTLNRIAAEQARRDAEIASARAQREGALSSYINAWDAQAQAARARSEDQLFSRGGVTGQIGATRRGVAQVGEDYARERATTEATGRQDILENYLGDMSGLGQWAYRARDDAFGGYYSDTGRYRDNYYSQRRGTTSARAQARRTGYNDQVSQYERGATRRDNLLARMTGAQGDFADYTSQSATARGQAIAQGYLGGAEARAAGGLASADAWNTGLNSVAKGVGDYWAQRNKAPKVTTDTISTRPIGGRATPSYGGYSYSF